MKDRRKIKCNTPACGCRKWGEKDLASRFTYHNIDKKIIWFDVPKCASTTIRSLKKLDLRRGNLPADSSEYFKFAVVRNPFDRIVSSWKMFTTPRVEELQSYNESFIEGLGNFDLKQFLQLIKIIDNHHWHPQSDFIALDLDYIIRFESLQQDFNVVCDKIGLPHQNLPLTNKSEHEHYSKYYTDEAREIVAEKYAKDIEYFGYKFENE